VGRGAAIQPHLHSCRVEIANRKDRESCINLVRNSVPLNHVNMIPTNGECVRGRSRTSEMMIRGTEQKPVKRLESRSITGREEREREMTRNGEMRKNTGVSKTRRRKRRRNGEEKGEEGEKGGGERGGGGGRGRREGVGRQTS
jgi:hypothetical protein